LINVTRLSDLGHAVIIKVFLDPFHARHQWHRLPLAWKHRPALLRKETCTRSTSRNGICPASDKAYIAASFH